MRKPASAIAYVLMTHCAVEMGRPNALSIAGSATFTIEKSSKSMKNVTLKKANDRHGGIRSAPLSAAHST
jgi:hypothetical protein